MNTRWVQTLLAALALAALPMSSFAFVSVGVSITLAPPALPVYVQPACPVVGYIWTPGYWAYDDGGYYWVPGTWVAAPEPGLLWTPGYWGWAEGVYVWHGGYWGPHVGFYGGVNYGFGYGGVGFEGGYWRGHDFYYNRAVANLNGIHVTNVYNKTVIVNNVNVTRVSYNGGAGGLTARPTERERLAEHDHHVEFTNLQREHEHLAAGNHDLRASANGGKPRIAATARPAVFSGRGVVAARAAGGPVHESPRPPISHAGTPGSIPQNKLQQARTDRPPGATGNVGHSSTMEHNNSRATGFPQGSGHPTENTHGGAQGRGAENIRPTAPPRAAESHSTASRPPEMRTAAPQNRSSGREQPQVRPREQPHPQMQGRPQESSHAPAREQPQMPAREQPHPQMPARAQEPSHSPAHEEQQGRHEQPHR